MQKIYELSELKDITKDLKRKTKVVGLCHGVFDLLHLGHIHYLEEAKSICDYLIVTITDDEFVNKGPGRPYFNSSERSKALSSLECVDFVGINRSKTALNLLKTIKPSIYIKGPDYKNAKDDPTDNLKKEISVIKKSGGEFYVTQGDQYSSSKILNDFFEDDDSINQYRQSLRNKVSSKMLKQYFDTLKDIKVLVIGEAILDNYVFCETVGKAGKDPFLVSRKKDSFTYLGGSLAGANNISDFVKDVRVLTYLGDRDIQLESIKEKLAQNVKLTYINKKDSPTINKTRFVDQNTNTKINGIYDINDSNLSRQDEEKFLKKLDKLIKSYDVVIAMDFGHGLFTRNVIKMITKKSKFLAVNVQQNSFNSGFYDISKFSKADLFTLHEGELRQHFRDKVSPVHKLLTQLDKIVDFKNIILTRGKKGALMKSCSKRKPISSPGLAKKIVDRVGSGDALLVTSALSIYKDHPDELSLLFGSISAAEIIKDYANSSVLDKADVLNSMTSFLK